MATSSGRPTVRGRATEAALQDAARRVVARKGFLNTTIADITSEAERSTASFYNYFDSKEDMLEGWAEDFQREARDRATAAYRSGASHRELIVASVRAHWETYKHYLAEMVGVSQFAMVNEDFAGRWRSLRAEAIESIAIGVERAQGEGHCPSANPRLVASAIVAMLNQFSYTWLAEGGEALDIEFDEEQAIKTLADIWYHAIYWKPSADAVEAAADGGRPDGEPRTDGPPPDRRRRRRTD
jgi:AcrR family transcriptional regulator